MGIGRSTFYDMPDARARDLTIVAEMKTICDEFEAYGYRRVGAELRHRGIVVNGKKIRRLMREHTLNPRQRRRFIATTEVPSRSQTYKGSAHRPLLLFWGPFAPCRLPDQRGPPRCFLSSRCGTAS